MIEFNADELDRLEAFAEIYAGFSASLNFQLPPGIAMSTEAFLKRKALDPAWKPYNYNEYVQSKKIDYLMVEKARSISLPAEVNEEGAITIDPAYDWSLASAKIEMKHMPGAVARQISYKLPFVENLACINWRRYDLFVAWCWCGGLYDNRIRPWVVTLNRFMSSEMWDAVWKPNTRSSLGGMHLEIDGLPSELRKGIILL